MVGLGVAIAATYVLARGYTIFGIAIPAPISLDDWSKVLGFTFGIPGAILALFTYERGVREQRRATLWKRREFVAARFDRLEALDACRAAMRMLDYNASYLDLDGLRDQPVNDRLVMSALAPHQSRGAYTRREQIIREVFDTFFSELDRLAAMASAGLIDERDLAPYADYWLKLFAPDERGRPGAYGAILRRYVRIFHFDALADLLQARRLIIASGDGAAKQARDDDDAIAAFNPEWVAPSDQPWDERVERVEASS